MIPDEAELMHETMRALERARVTANVAHQIVIKFKQMGLPESFDKELAALSTDLGDLWGAQKSFSDRIELLLSNNVDDWKSTGEHLVDLRGTIDHMAWHLKSVRKPLTKVTQFAYKCREESV